jgi:ribA/ribD-fused uncharacterized protein
MAGNATVQRMVSKMYVVPKFEGDWFFLSNFSPSPISFKTPAGVISFATGEHAFQAAKYKAMVGTEQDKIEYIQNQFNSLIPNEAKRLGRQVKIDLSLWESIRVDCMREIVFRKFHQNETLRQRLLDTGAAMLVEGNTWGDKFWGRCDGKGYNLLGSILMECRGYWHWRSRKGEDFDG